MKVKGEEPFQGQATFPAKPWKWRVLRVISSSDFALFDTNAKITNGFPAPRHRLADGFRVERVPIGNLEKQPFSPFDHFGNNPPRSGLWDHRNQLSEHSRTASNPVEGVGS
jgi:hypothetical protein